MFLNRKETAKTLGIAVSTLDLRIKDGRDLPSFVKIGSAKKLKISFYHYLDCRVLDKCKAKSMLKYRLTIRINDYLFEKIKSQANLDKKYLDLEQNINLFYKNGKFKCRDDLISFIKDSGFTVTRIGKDYISLRCLGAKKSRRFKGEIFNEEFIDLNSLNELKKQKQEKIEKYENINKGKIDESNSYRANSITKSREKREGVYADIRSIIKDIDDFRKRYERFAREYGENESCIRKYVESTSGVLSAFMEKTKLVKDNYSDMDLEI